MSIITVGIDLAKNIFAVHGVNEIGKAELVKPKVNRDQLLPLMANLPPMPDRHGSVQRSTSLGATVPEAWPHGALDRAQVRYALPHVRPSRQE